MQCYLNNAFDQNMNQDDEKGEEDLFLCAICNEMAGGKFVVNACKHELCKKCIHSSTMNDIIYNKRIPRCPFCMVSSDSNITEILENELKQILNENEMNLYYNMQLSIALQNIKIYQCPTPNCQFIAEVANMDFQYFICDKCRISCCMNCKAQPYHNGKTCDEYRKYCKQNEDENDIKLKNLATEQGWKSCPNCKQIIERTYGCYHMQCGNVLCNTHYCDLCGNQLDPKKWKEHFNPPNPCVLWHSEADLLANTHEK